jgi:hypothetical protein
LSGPDVNRPPHILLLMTGIRKSASSSQPAKS